MRSFATSSTPRAVALRIKRLAKGTGIQPVPFYCVVSAPDWANGGFSPWRVPLPCIESLCLPGGPGPYWRCALIPGIRFTQVPRVPRRPAHHPRYAGTYPRTPDRRISPPRSLRHLSHTHALRRTHLRPVPFPGLHGNQQPKDRQAAAQLRRAQLHLPYHGIFLPTIGKMGN